jgi:hypothetical protein
LTPETKKDLMTVRTQSIGETLEVIAKWVGDNASFHIQSRSEDPYDGDITSDFISDLKKL